MNYSKLEKIKIILDIVFKLKNFPDKHGGTVNFYNNTYTYYDEFKAITNKWMLEEGSEYKGKLYFGEIGKYFEYHFPKYKAKETLFVLRYGNN
jgi:hypothetical protein